MMLFEIFRSFFFIGLLSIGGGYATLPLIQAEIVAEQQWLTIQEFSDIVTISQMTPGPLAVNSATFVGLQVAGLLGAIFATVACISSGCAIALALDYFFSKNKENVLMQQVFSGLKSATVGLIAAASLSMITLAFSGTLHWYEVRSFNWIPIVLFAVFFVLLRKKKLSPITLLVLAGAIGFLVY
ncbi:chromate transporter [Enterococcus florum]|uniref:Chromate transporter n=1 Tax=Enterococcus florum TaxID=2480627 RepID=A0A4V0WP87_9ENTE|nr:chromate transporter [Enterococcus florum]GCF92999.1 chromate transporter [Enterococcus florum]